MFKDKIILMRELMIEQIVYNLLTKKCCVD
jgi:hypothetical protein